METDGQTAGDSVPEVPRTGDAPFVPLSRLMEGDLREVLDGVDARAADDYPYALDAERRSLARDLFMRERLTSSEIAERTDTPERTVILWATRGGWLKALEEEADFRRREERLRIADIRNRNRRRVVEESLETAQSIRAKANERMGDAQTPGQLKAVAEAVNLSSTVELRVAGLSEAGRVEREDDGDGGKDGGKAPLVVVFKGSPDGLPPIRAAEVIDVDGEA